MLPFWIRTRTGHTYHLFDEHSGTAACYELPSIHRIGIYAEGTESIRGYRFCAHCMGTLDDYVPDGPEAGQNFPTQDITRHLFEQEP